MRLTNASGERVIERRKQWLRCGFENVALAGDLVGLPVLDAVETSIPGAETAAPPAGLAFDAKCRLFRSLPELARIESLLWAEADPFVNGRAAPVEFEIRPEGSELAPKISEAARALACDDAGFLWLADADLKTLWVVDLQTARIAREIALSGMPVDLAAHGDRVYVLLNDPTGWGVVSACTDFESLPWKDPREEGSRIDCAGDPLGGGRAFVLVRAGTEDATLVQIGDKTITRPVPYCTDFVIVPADDDGVHNVVCARRSGDDFVKFALDAASDPTPLAAPGYDGRGIALSPEGRVAFFTEFGVGTAAPARLTYAADAGCVFGYALDSEHDRATWGTLVVEACIPPGTSIRFHAFTRDDVDVDDARERLPPSNDDELTPIPEPEATPLLSRAAWEHRVGGPQTLFRQTPPQLLDDAAQGAFARYDAPIVAEPGRYLWLVFELRGTRHKSPKLRAVRVAYPGHDLLRLLPRTLWRDEAAQSFLTRYLMPLAALLKSWGDASAGRRRLLDPCAAPASALDWLASFLALAMEPCWPEAARREMILEAAELFRYRGTVWSLRRMLEILTGAEVVLLEKFRTRGGGLVGNPEATQSSAVLGVGMRVGGTLGVADAATQPAGVGAGGVTDDEFAHRFTVTVVAPLTSEQLRCAVRLVEAHKPAHTAFDLCAAHTGVRVGVGLHVGVAAVVGNGSGFDPVVLGDAVLGKGYVVGRPPLDGGAGTGGVS